MRTRRLALAGIPIAFFAVFFAYPVGTILGRGLWPGGSLDLSPIGDVFGDARLRQIWGDS